MSRPQWEREQTFSEWIRQDAFVCAISAESMEHFIFSSGKAGIKLFNKVIDRLGVDMDRQRCYEVFDRIYEEGMREKKFERGRNSR